MSTRFAPPSAQPSRPGERLAASMKAAKLQELADTCRANFSAFVKEAWPIVEPRRLVEPSWEKGAGDGGYMRTICDHLQAIYEGKLRRRSLLVNIAPRHAKSTICSVLFPAWIWAKDPTYRMLFGSYALQLALRDSRQTRKLVASDWYQRHFVQGAWKIEEGDDRAGDFATTAGGRRMCVAVGSAGTGFGGQLIVVDDPLNVEAGSPRLERGPGSLRGGVPRSE